MSPRAKPVPPMTAAEYDARLAAQGGTCAIRGCGARPKTRRFHRDHDHKTGSLRGLLCHKHNRALPAWITADELRALAEYLDGAG